MKKVFATRILVVLLVSILALSGCASSAPATSTAPEPAPSEAAPSAAPSADAEPSAATDYPKKQINLIIQAGPGGLSDTTARTVGAELSKELGVPVIFANKPGASGAVAMSFVQASAPDGYTIGYVPVELALVKALGFASDIEPAAFDLICSSNTSPAAITVNAKSPYNTIEDLITAAKANPMGLKCGNSGTGSIWHIAGKSFERAAGIEFNYVPFDGAVPAVAALMGGHIDLTSVSPMEVKAGIDSGELRMLAVMSAERDPMYPDVPTLKESGFDSINVQAWGGFALPKGTPQEVKDILAAAFEKSVNSEAFKKVTAERNYSIMYKNSEDFAKFAQEQFDFYMGAMADLDIK